MVNEIHQIIHKKVEICLLWGLLRLYFGRSYNVIIILSHHLDKHI